MNGHDLQAYLHEHIPLSRAMQVTVMEISGNSVTLAAPLGPNINHRGTVFGGSVSAVAILAAWSLLHMRLSAAGVDCRLVIQRNSMQYLKPVESEFTARSSMDDMATWEAFLRMLRRKGRARLTVRSVLESGGGKAGEFEGEFVALTSGSA